MVTVTTTEKSALASGQGVVISGVAAGGGGCSSAAAAAIDGEQTITATGYEAFTFTSSQSATIAVGDCTLTSATAVGATPFQPLYDFAYSLGSFYPPPGIQSQAGFGTLNTQDLLNGQYLATAGLLTVTKSAAPPGDTGTYPLLPGGPDFVTIFGGAVGYDNVLFPDYPALTPAFDGSGIMFTDSTWYITLLYDSTGGDDVYDNWNYHPPAPGIPQFLGGPFALNNDPGGGQTSPAKYTFDVTEAPSCTSDFVAMGIPANAVTGAQANIVGYNYLYTPSDGTSDTCTGTGPNVMFAYASGTGEVPGSVSLSTDGTQLAYVEDQLTGSSVFHVLTIGTTGTNGTSPTAPVVPGPTGGNNAVDTTRPLSGGSGSCAPQSSTTSPFINFANNAAYVTTYAWTGAGTGTGCLYKISNIFASSGGTAPIIAWSVPIGAVPSSPVWDSVSGNVFFTDSSGNIDSVTDNGSTATVNTPLSVAAGATSENPVTVDSSNEMVYATFNFNGTGAVVVQAPTNLASFVSAPVGLGSKLFTGPYGVDFSNAFYADGPTSPGALLYVAGTDVTTGTVPTLYSIGFNATTGVMDTTANSSTPLATSTDPDTGNPTVADASDVTEFYNTTTSTDYLFVGVTDSCIATGDGGQAGCVMSLNITSGFPTVGPTITTAIPAPGGSTGIIVDNDADTTPITGYPEASSIYYDTKNGGTLVKVTQNDLY
jgi:hypothetical protein